jgi:hypothetical protein
MEVSALAFHLQVRFGQKVLRLLVAFAAFLAPCQASLCQAQFA